MAPDKSNWDAGPVGDGNYTVRQGDCIESIAFEHGLFWETVWNDPQNAELKRVRENPNAILPFDQVYVREKSEKEVPGATEQKHRFRRKGVPSNIHLVFRGIDDEPRANEPYELAVDGSHFFSGTTDSDGAIQHPIPPNARSCSVTLGSDGESEEIEIDFGHIDPITELSGVISRLHNLGYYCDVENDSMTESARRAVRSFQEDHGIRPTGEIDGATLSALEGEYGG